MPRATKLQTLADRAVRGDMKAERVLHEMGEKLDEDAKRQRWMMFVMSSHNAMLAHQLQQILKNDVESEMRIGLTLSLSSATIDSLKSLSRASGLKPGKVIDLLMLSLKHVPELIEVAMRTEVLDTLVANTEDLELTAEVEKAAQIGLERYKKRTGRDYKPGND